MLPVRKIRNIKNVVAEQYTAKHDETEQGKGDVQHLCGKEFLYPVMVVHSLHQVAHQFGVEERHGKFQQFDEEVGYQGDIDAHADMEQYPSADKIHTGAAYGQYELSQQDQVNDSQVLMGNTYIYDGLCKKGK